MADEVLMSQLLRAMPLKRACYWWKISINSDRYDQRQVVYDVGELDEAFHASVFQSPVAKEHEFKGRTGRI